MHNLPNRPLTLDLKIAFNKENTNSHMSTTSTNEDDESNIESMIENSKNASIKPKTKVSNSYSPNLLSRSTSIKQNNHRSIRNSNDQNYLKSSSIMPANQQLASSSISLSSSIASSSVPSSISPATSPRMISLQQPTQPNQNNLMSQSPNLLNIHQYMSSSPAKSNNLSSPSGNAH